MDTLMKVNLTNLFRQQGMQRTLKSTEIQGEIIQRKSPVHTTSKAFLVDSKYALQLDEII